MALTIGPEEKAKLVKLLDEGTQVLQEADDLRSGLRDTVKHIAVELDVNTKLISLITEPKLKS